jgi:putative PIN family toxin of toxin-antitoxin system
MKIVMDTNVLVSGLLNPFGPTGGIMRMVSSAELILCQDARILCEYTEVLARPRFRFTPQAVSVLLDFINRSGISVAASPLSFSLPDPDDLPFLEVALAARADYLVMGNRTRFPVLEEPGTDIVAPADFVLAYRARHGS